MLTTPDLDLEHLRGWIGREETASELLTPTIVARLYATLDREGPTDDGAEAPLLTHHCLCQPAAPTAALGPDGHPQRGGFLPPVPLPRRMWAGGALSFKTAPRIGQTVTRRSLVEDVTMKQGRSGRLCFVTVTHHVSSGGRDVLTERQDIVYRDVTPSRGGPAAAPPPAPTGEHQRSISTSPERLFRYSALTFNSHRIHFDFPYTTTEEGYPGLVVHGPLQAMLLAQYAADLRGRAPQRFRFRSLSPVFGGAPLLLNAQDSGDALELWTACPDGPVAMEARAEW
ncbi:MaoC family dehydratase N-terminal domain-containing protein [Salipiger sp. PrR002]|uniref:FAS1-like dehydratase domain-containing protein n=1 Tax=Salipiger sp. PrR002 TaxID=2706489 RepID=UPI0013B8F881|nr:MaoC family dehydratase N-terminal domain-containing protein [Salipiger sp. PrR002]NDW02277.1 protein dehydratase [Salipiger sp. PrR002]NDW59280.1 protein dehydratase [Salipiger sp. PrR004]